MQRGIHITISLVAVLLLLKPFCFSNGPFTRKAAACCKKGKCTPSTGADECCKGTIPGGKQLVASKASEHSAPALYIVSADLLGSVDLSFAHSSLVDIPSPPGSPPIARVNLPLLI
jgi:hypothetical protein